MTGVLRECDVLAPRAPAKHQSPDDWPEFTLSEVRIHVVNDSGTACSLFDASEHCPVTVTGLLEPPDPDEPDAAHLYTRSITEPQSIVIPDVRMFSYGQYPDGTIQVWAAGKAGWHAITPSSTYKTIHDEMIQQVRTLYFVADTYKAIRKSGKGRNATILPPYSFEELSAKYATEVLSHPNGNDEAVDQFYKHKEFLLSSMIQGKEGLDWTDNPLFEHLQKKFELEYISIKQKLSGRGANRKAVNRAASQSRQPSVESNSTRESQKRKRGRPKRFRQSNDDDDAASNSTQLARAANSRHSRQRESLPRTLARARSSGSTSGDETSGDLDEVSSGVKSGKSILRPKTSQSGKAPGKFIKTGNPFTMMQFKYRQSQGSNHPPRVRRRNSKSNVDEGIDMPTSPSVEGDEHLLDDKPEFPLQTAGHPDPVQEDTWKCALDGCSHKVYAASQSESQKLIKEHYALHAYDDDDRVRLVRTLQAPSLPVGHLMQRVRQQAKMDGFPGSRVAGTRYPSGSVVQRY